MKKNKIIALAIAAVVLSAGSVKAQSIRTSYSVTASEPFAVKYIGSEADYLVFDVTYNLPGAHAATFEIAEKNEGAMYREILKVDATTKRVKIEKKDFKELEFKLSSGSNKYSKAFSVTTGQIEETDVKEKVGSM